MAELPAPSEPAAGQAPETVHKGSHGLGGWLPYLLGLSLQTFLWFLLFLGIVVAVMVGGRLTEFRYVGF